MSLPTNRMPGDLIQAVDINQIAEAVNQLSDSGTSGPGVDIQVGGTQPASGWWLDNGQPIPGIPVTPTGPTWTDDLENGGGTWTTPTEEGVTYSPASGTATPEQLVVVNAYAQEGYELHGVTTWARTFPAAPPAPPTLIDTFTRTVNRTTGSLGEADSGQVWPSSSVFASVDGEKAVIEGVRWMPDVFASNSVDVAADLGVISGVASGGNGPCLYIGSSTANLRLMRTTGTIVLATNIGGFKTLATRGSGLPDSGRVRMVVESSDGQQGTVSIYSDGVFLGPAVTISLTAPITKGVGIGSNASNLVASIDNLTILEI